MANIIAQASFMHLTVGPTEPIRAKKETDKEGGNRQPSNIYVGPTEPLITYKRRGKLRGIKGK